MEADKSVTTGIDVSMVTPELVTQPVPMPVCEYTVRERGPEGEVVKYVVLGDQV